MIAHRNRHCNLEELSQDHATGPNCNFTRAFNCSSRLCNLPNMLSAEDLNDALTDSIPKRVSQAA